MSIRLKENQIERINDLSKRLDLSISKAIDRLAEFGAAAPVEYGDSLKGAEYLKRMKER